MMCLLGIDVYTCFLFSFFLVILPLFTPLVHFHVVNDSIGSSFAVIPMRSASSESNPQHPRQSTSESRSQPPTAQQPQSIQTSTTDSVSNHIWTLTASPSKPRWPSRRRVPRGSRSQLVHSRLSSWDSMLLRFIILLELDGPRVRFQSSRIWTRMSG